jgi:hypothetical protein
VFAKFRCVRDLGITSSSSSSSSSTHVSGGAKTNDGNVYGEELHGKPGHTVKLMHLRDAAPLSDGDLFMQHVLVVGVCGCVCVVYVCV